MVVRPTPICSAISPSLVFPLSFSIVFLAQISVLLQKGTSRFFLLVPFFSPFSPLEKSYRFGGRVAHDQIITLLADLRTTSMGPLEKTLPFQVKENVHQSINH